MGKIKLVCCLVVYISTIACQKKQERGSFYLEKFDFKNPDKIIDLPKELNEISGISYYEDNQIALICDDKPYVYFYDLSKQKIIQKIKLRSGGDFEDIAIFKKYVFVLQSNGIVWKLNIDNQTQIDAVGEPISTPYEVEGLCFNESKDSLYVAAKYWSEDPNKTTILPVWSFHKNQEIDYQKPIFCVTSSKVSDNGSKQFHTSAILKTPSKSSWVLLSTNDKFIIEINQFGDILSKIQLPQSIFKQPEGMTLDQEGNLYISNEADKNSSATLLKFKMKH